MEKKQPCQYYLRGNCKFGEHCRFSHDIDISMRSNNPSNTNNNPIIQQNNNSNYCTHFLMGNCKRGEKCAYFHGYCGRLQHFKTINNHKNVVNELILNDKTSYISVDDNEFFIRKLENQNENDDISKNICEGYKIRKSVFSGNKFICCVEKDSA